MENELAMAWGFGVASVTLLLLLIFGGDTDDHSRH
jgi:hypothetical protein